MTSRSLRIAVWHNLPSGGGKRALYDHIRGLLQLGHEVEAWRPPTADSTFLPLADLVREHVVDLKWPVPGTRGDTWQITLQMERALASMDAHARACAEQIDRGGFDVVLANSCMFFACGPIARRLRTPCVLYLQEPFRELYEAYPTLPWVARPAGSFALGRPRTWRKGFVDLRCNRDRRAQARDEALNARAYDRILVNSYFSRESVLRAYGVTSEVCYLGVDADHFADHGLPREDFVAGLGSITVAKNIALAIRAVAAVPPPRPRLCWMGNVASRDYRDEMSALAASLGVAIEFRTNVPHQEVVEVLNRATAMLYTPRLEPFGFAPLEANACGAPVVAVLEGGVRETVRHEVNGLVANPNPHELGRAVQRLRDDPALARRLGAQGRDLVRSEWSIGAAALRLERHLRDVASAVGPEVAPVVAPEVATTFDSAPSG